MRTPRPQIPPQEDASGKPSIGFRLWQPGAILLLLGLVAGPGLAEAPVWPWPVPTNPAAITGTFMESRETRFHTGLDIRTEGRGGWPVSSPIDGYLRRLRVSARASGLRLYREGGLVPLLLYDRPLSGWEMKVGEFDRARAEGLPYVRANPGGFEWYGVDLPPGDELPPLAFPRARARRVRAGRYSRRWPASR